MLLAYDWNQDKDVCSCYFCSTLYWTGYFGQFSEARARNKSMQILKEDVKLLIDDTIIYIENS